MPGGSPEGPRGELSVRTLAMPADTKPAGDIFGGWIMSLMDVAGGLSATCAASGRVATVAVTDMALHLPVKVGDVVSGSAELVRVGRTSLTLRDRPGAAPAHRRPHQRDLSGFHLCRVGRCRPAAPHSARGGGRPNPRAARLKAVFFTGRRPASFQTARRCARPATGGFWPRARAAASLAEMGDEQIH